MTVKKCNVNLFQLYVEFIQIHKTSIKQLMT